MLEKGSKTRATRFMKSSQTKICVSIAQFNFMILSFGETERLECDSDYAHKVLDEPSRQQSHSIMPQSILTMASMRHTEGGILPDSCVSYNHSAFKCTRFANGGTVPLKPLFAEKRRLLSCVSDPISVGRDPFKEFSRRLRSVSFVSHPNADGTDPFKKLERRFNTASSVNKPSKDGMGPVKVFSRISRWVSFVNDVSEVGMGPFRKLPLRFKNVSRSMRPISVGMVP